MPEACSVYQPRKPHLTPYYQSLQDHFETFEHVYENRFPGDELSGDAVPLPRNLASSCSDAINKAMQVHIYIPSRKTSILWIGDNDTLLRKLWLSLIHNMTNGCLQGNGLRAILSESPLHHSGDKEFIQI